MKNHIAPIAFAAVLFGCTAGAFAGEAQTQTKVAPESKLKTRKVATAVEPRKKTSEFMARWRRTGDRPCDSIACRPQRFAWAPTAPGD